MLTASKLMEAAVKRGSQLVERETPGYIRQILDRGFYNLDDPDFSARGFMESLRDVVAGRSSMSEATPTGALGFLLRAATQRIMDGWFTENQSELSYLQVCATVNSNKRQEFYNPLHTAAVQSKTVEGEPYSESAVRGEDVVLVNQKFMGGESFTSEMFDDDLTGQIRQRQSDLAEAAIRTLEVYFALRFLGTAGSFGPLNVPASNWTSFSTSVNEFNQTLAGIFTPRVGTAGLGNRIGTLRPLSTPALKECNTLLRQMRDLQGNRLGYKADTLLISPTDEIHADIIANSAYYPSIQGLQGETYSTGTSGRAGSHGAVNPWRGAFKVVVNRYFTDWAWALGMAGRGIVFQLRDPVQIQQEAPNAGKSFDLDGVRLRSRARWEIDWTDPRPWILGSDGTGSGIGAY